MNDKVWLLNAAVDGAATNKLSYKWSGPFVILSKAGSSDVNYKIKREHVQLDGRSKPKIVHAMQLD